MNLVSTILNFAEKNIVLDYFRILTNGIAFFSDLSNFRKIDDLPVTESSLRKIQQRIFLFLKIYISKTACLDIVIFYVTSLNQLEAKT